MLRKYKKIVKKWYALMVVKSGAKKIQRATKACISSLETSVVSLWLEHTSSLLEENPYKTRLEELLLLSFSHISDSAAPMNPKMIQWIPLKEGSQESSWDEFAEGRIDRQFQIGRITNFFT